MKKTQILYESVPNLMKKTLLFPGKRNKTAGPCRKIYSAATLKAGKETMAARDKYHNAAKNGLIKDGWFDPNTEAIIEWKP